MSVTRTMQIVDAAYRTILRHTNLHVTNQFEIRKVDRSIAHSSVLFQIYIIGIGSASLGSGTYELVDRIGATNLSECGGVPSLLHSRLLSDGFVHREVMGAAFSFIQIQLEPLGPEVTLANKSDAEKHASFFRRVCLTPEQLRAVQAELPAGAPTDDLFLLSCFSGDVLRDCGLTRVQIAAWEKLITERPAA